MIFPIIFALGAGYFGWNLIIDMAYRVDTADYVMAGFVAVLGGLLGLMIGMLLSHFVGAFLPKIWSKPTIYKLAAMRNGNAVHGNFYLMRGSVNGGWAYNYYVKQGEQLRPEDLLITGNNILVEEIETGDPRLEVCVMQFRLGWFEWFAALDGNPRYHFYIPTGSVSEGFDV